MAGRGEREGLQRRMRTLLGGTDTFIILLLFTSKHQMYTFNVCSLCQPYLTKGIIFLNAIILHL